MEIEFDFRKEESRLFGTISRPVARVIFINHGKELAEHLYIDSGADITLVPKSVGEWLGFKIGKADQIVEIKGVGERGIPIVVKKVTIKIGGKLIDARVATPEEEAMNAQFRRRFAEAVEKLPKKERNVWKKYYVDGMTMEDIGKMEGISTGWVSRLVAATNKLLEEELKDFREN